MSFNKTNGLQADTSNTYQLAFQGEILYVNWALSNLSFIPQCPFKTGQKIAIKVSAAGKDGKPASG